MLKSCTTLARDDRPRADAQTDQRLEVPIGAAEVAIRMLALPHRPGLAPFEFTGPRQRNPAPPCDLGWQHVAFYTDDIDSAIEGVVCAGGSVLAEPRPLPWLEAGARNKFVYCRTPWGSTLELISYPNEQPYTHTTKLRRWRP